MRKLFIFILSFLLLSSIAFCDELLVPFPCFPKNIQQKFIERGYKLDLDSNDRTKDSWGFLVNEGQQFKIYTYDHVTDEELNMVMQIFFEDWKENQEEQ